MGAAWLPALPGAEPCVTALECGAGGTPGERGAGAGIRDEPQGGHRGDTGGARASGMSRGRAGMRNAGDIGGARGGRGVREDSRRDRDAERGGHRGTPEEHGGPG